MPLVQIELRNCSFSLTCKQIQSQNAPRQYCLISPSVPFSLSVMRSNENWKPLVFQPISCLKRLPTSAPCQHTPLSRSLTFIWHTDNRKIAGAGPPPSPFRYSAPLHLNSATAGMHPVSHAIVICLFWSGKGLTLPDTHRYGWAHVLTHKHIHRLINHFLLGLTVVQKCQRLPFLSQKLIFNDMLHYNYSK